MWQATRRYMTLLEVFLVIALLGIAAGAVAINIRKAIYEQRFRGDVATVVNALQLAQQVMLILNTDVQVKFSQLPDNQGIQYTLEFEDPMSPGWKKEIQRQHPPLKLVLDYRPANQETRQAGSEVLRFLSGGTVMSRGILRLSDHIDPNAPGALNSYIVLPGFPQYISSQPTPPSLDNTYDFAAQEVYNQRLTQFTVEEVRHNMQLPK